MYNKESKRHATNWDEFATSKINKRPVFRLYKDMLQIRKKKTIHTQKNEQQIWHIVTEEKNKNGKCTYKKMSDFICNQENAN